MKNSKLTIPLSMTAALVGLMACASSCAKKSDTPKPETTPPEPPPTNAASASTNTASVTTNSIATNAPVEVAAAPADTNAPAAAPAAEITNSPPAQTTVTAPETTTLTETNVPGHATIVDMPASAPTAPTNFYAGTLTNSANACCLTDDSQCSTNFFLSLRAGYQHINHGDNNDSYWVSAKFYAYGDGLREAAGKNAWLIPDADIELSSGLLAKPDNSRSPGSDSGLRLRADVTWPWFHWTSYLMDNTNTVCPFCEPITFTLGPTINLGFDHLYDETDLRFARYAGVRLSFNRDGFIEYTVGETEGLNGTRQQIVFEFPFWESRDRDVHYYLRGLWNHGASNKPDILEGGLFLEATLGTLVTPSKWGDLVPFLQ